MRRRATHAPHHLRTPHSVFGTSRIRKNPVAWFGLFIVLVWPNWCMECTPHCFHSGESATSYLKLSFLRTPESRAEAFELIHPLLSKSATHRLRLPWHTGSLKTFLISLLPGYRRKRIFALLVSGVASDDDGVIVHSFGILNLKRSRLQPPPSNLLHQSSL